MLYSLRKVLLNEAIITQQNFIKGLVDIIKERPAAAGVKNCRSYDDIVGAIKRSIEEGKDKSRDTVEIDGLELSQEEASFYNDLKSQFDEKEKRRLMSIEIKNSKNIPLSKKDQIPIKFNSGIFFKKWNEQKALLQSEGNICAEIVKIVEFFDVLTEKDKKARKNLEQVAIDQIRKYKNLDGSVIELRGILPLYDSMLKFIKKKADVNINDCIMAADLYMKDLYRIANEETISQMELGNVDFSEVFSKTKFYEEFMQEFVLNQKNLHIYEDENVKIIYPTGNFAFNQTIKKLGRTDVTWCTKMLSSWLHHTFDKEEYVCIMNVKNVPKRHKDYIISLKVGPNGFVDYTATCDANNEHMSQNSLSIYLTPSILKEIENKTNSVLQNIVYDKEKDTDEVMRIAGNLAKSGLFFALQTLVSTFMCSDKFYKDPINFSRIFKKIYINTDSSLRNEFYKLLITTVSEAYFNNRDFGENLMKRCFDLDIISTAPIDIENEESEVNRSISLDQSQFVDVFVEILKNRSAGFAGVMYYKSFNDLVDDNIRDNVSDSDLIEMFKVALNTENPVYFSTAMDYMFASSYGKKYLTREEIEKPSHTPQFKIVKDAVVESRGFKSFISRPSIDDFASIVENARSANLHSARNSPLTRKSCFIASLIFKDIEKTVDAINEINKNQKIDIEGVICKTIGSMLIGDTEYIVRYLLSGREKELAQRIRLSKGHTDFLDSRYFSAGAYLDICKNIFENDSYLNKIKQVDVNIHGKFLSLVIDSISVKVRFKPHIIRESNRERLKTMFSHVLTNISTSSSDLKRKVVDHFGIIANFYGNTSSMSSLEVEGLKSCFFLGSEYSLWQEKLTLYFDTGTSNMQLAKSTLDFILSLSEAFEPNEQRLFCTDLLGCIQEMHVYNKDLLRYVFEKLSSNAAAVFCKVIDEKCAPTVEAVLSGNSYNWSNSARPLFQVVDNLTLLVDAKKVFGSLSDRTVMGIIRSLYRPITIDKLDEIHQKYIKTGLIDEENSEIPAMLRKSKTSLFQTAASRKKVTTKELKLFVSLVEECNEKGIALSEYEIISLLKTRDFQEEWGPDGDLDIIDFKHLLIKNLFKFRYNNDPEKIINFMKRFNKRARGDLASISFEHGLQRSAEDIIKKELDEETAQMIDDAVKADLQQRRRPGRPNSNESILKSYIKTLLS